jgi:hypothetical protein
MIEASMFCNDVPHYLASTNGPEKFVVMKDGLEENLHASAGSVFDVVHVDGSVTSSIVRTVTDDGYMNP